MGDFEQPGTRELYGEPDDDDLIGLWEGLLVHILVVAFTIAGVLAFVSWIIK